MENNKRFKIKEFDRYEISITGEIYDTKTNKILKPHINKGYCRIRLYDNKKGKSFYIHKLIAIYFIDNPNDKPFINHKNGIKNDNRIDNLEWCTHKENMQHASRTGLSVFPKGENARMSKINNKTAINIVEDFKSLKIKELVIKYKLSKSTIYLIVTGRRWENATGLNIKNVKRTSKDNSLEIMFPKKIKN